MNEFDFTTLFGRARAIYDGVSGLTEFGPGNTRESYVKLWVSGAGIPRAATDLSCIHRGEEVDRIRCTTCQDKVVMVKVFACELFGPCCIVARQENGIRCCTTCSDRKSAKTESLAEKDAPGLRRNDANDSA